MNYRLYLTSKFRRMYGDRLKPYTNEQIYTAWLRGRREKQHEPNRYEITEAQLFAELPPLKPHEPYL